MDGLDEDFLGHAAAEGDRRVGPAASNEEGPPEDGLAIELDEVAFVEAEGHETPPDALAAGEVDDPEGGVARCVEQGHRQNS
jgi:hypothetical protein